MTTLGLVLQYASLPFGVILGAWMAWGAHTGALSRRMVIAVVGVSSANTFMEYINILGKWFEGVLDTPPASMF